ncbi:MAG: MCP four helix bundle domain-containing protein [Bacteroidales bacterium]|nr:MCP four helix bundle domain-containing protein [Bacteroidales bacterium]
MFKKFRSRLKNFKLSLRMKMVLSLSAIAVVLLISSVISVMEYRKMSSYVSELIADNIKSINVAHDLMDAVDNYNLQVLAVIGDDSLSSLPDFDQDQFVSHCDSLKRSFTLRRSVPLADSVLYSYSAYMLTSLELETVIESDFSSRTWYFERLQPVFNRMRSDITELSDAMYEDLQQNSATFERGFYRSIIPGAVAVGVGIVLVLLLMFFISVYYVNPLYRMLDSLDNYRSFRRKYSYTFEGDDQLSALNTGIMELTEENRALERRIKDIRDRGHES